MCARSACASNFARQLSQFAPSTVQTRDSNRASRVQLTCHRGLPVIFSPTTGSRVHKETRQASSSATNENSTQHCRSKLSTVTAPLPRLKVRCGEGDATGRGFWQSYGLTRCHGEAVSTSARVCNCSVYVNKNSTRNAKYCNDDFPDRGPAPRQRQTVKTCSLCLLLMTMTPSERKKSVLVRSYGFESLARAGPHALETRRLSLGHGATRRGQRSPSGEPELSDLGTPFVMRYITLRSFFPSLANTTGLKVGSVVRTKTKAQTWAKIQPLRDST